MRTRRHMILGWFGHDLGHALGHGVGMMLGWVWHNLGLILDSGWNHFVCIVESWHNQFGIMFAWFGMLMWSVWAHFEPMFECIVEQMLHTREFMIESVGHRLGQCWNNDWWCWAHFEILLDQTWNHCGMMLGSCLNHSGINFKFKSRECAYLKTRLVWIWIC